MKLVQNNELLVSSMDADDLVLYWLSGVILMIWCYGRLNKKDGLTRYGDSHVKDKTS